MSDRDDFLTWVESRVRKAEIAVHDSDASLRREIWSRKEPVTVLGAAKSATGRAELDELFSWMGRGCLAARRTVSRSSRPRSAGDMAYTVEYEHTQAVIDAESRTYTLRATQIYRREGGEWKVIHRHGSELPEGAALGD